MPKLITMAANAAAVGLQPNSRGTKNKQTTPRDMGSAIAHAVTRYESANSPRGESASTPTAFMPARATTANGTARKTSPGALSE
ncbi:MAG: hypothetical protein DMG99_05775 [Acidobacteria bacterium]|nr:MAG: hypothetical protein DMG99_05775 [Acidobacteriota bacterium]